MTYQEWFAELNTGRGTELQEKKRLIEEAAERCSEKARDALKPFLQYLDDLFTGPAGDAAKPSDLFFDEDDSDSISELDYELMPAELGSEFVSMMNRYEPPVELIQQQGVADALSDIFDSLGVLDGKYEVTGFKKSDERDEAVRNDRNTYAAQILAMKDMKGETALRDILAAAVSIPRWKRDSGFRNAMKDREIQRRLFQGDGAELALSAMEDSLNRYDIANAKTFKQISEDAARLYREKYIDYAGLERSMNILRAIAKQKTNSDDRNSYDNVMITTSELRNMAEKFQTAEKPSEAYQAELADSNVMVQDHITERVHNVYDAKPVFQENFDNPDSKGDSYRRQDFERHMKEIDISGLRFGDEDLSNEEFGSLGFLSVLDPKIAGSILSIGGKSVQVKNGNLDIAVSMLLHCTVAFGNETKKVNGQTVYGPEMRVGSAMELCVAPARDKAAKALEAWKNNDPTQLGKLIADGANIFVNDVRHAEISNGAINKHLAVYANMVKGTLDLLKRSPILMQAAETAGLKPETIREMEGILMANRIEKAGQEAKKRILESAQGRRIMNSFEKEQCILAVQRYEAMIENIEGAEKAWRASKGYGELSDKIENLNDHLEKKYGPDYKKNPNAIEERWRLQYKYIHEQTKLLKRPGVYMTLGRDGVKGLDRMIPEGRLDREKAKSFVELAQDLGLTEKREIKTTAKQVYDLLTKEYKAHRLTYDQYVDRLRTMRELTGDNKNAKVDIEVIEDVLEAKRLRSLNTMESQIEAMLGTDSGVLPQRVRHITETYGLTPKINENSVKEEGALVGGYTRKQFAQLEAIQEGPGENFLHLDPSKEISQADFAALAVAATQAFPEIGGVFISMDSMKTSKPNVLTEPTLDDAANFRGFYLTDLDYQKGTARDGVGVYIGAAIVPARKKAEEALRSFQAGNGSPELLTKILGCGLHRFVNTMKVANDDDGILSPDRMTECAFVGRLAEIAEKNPALMDEAVKNKYMTQEDLEKAKGLGTLYRISAGAALAKQKLTASANGEQKLTTDERRACVELMLREKVLQDSACRQAKKNLPEETMNKLYDQLISFDRSTTEKDARAATFIDQRMREIIGLPDYIRTLGVKGAGFARELLDSSMPNRDALLNKSDAEILESLNAKFDTKEDPFLNKEYTKPVSNKDHLLNRNLRGSKTKETTPSQKIL